MADARMTRRLAGVLNARMPELGLAEVEDGRSRLGKRWRLESILSAVIIGAAAGRKSLAEVEELTDSLPRETRKLVRIRRRLPDTTARTALGKQSVFEARKILHRQVQVAKRRKVLKPWGLPCGVLTMDGKVVTLPAWDDHYAQRHTTEGGLGAVGLARTVSCTLVSSEVAVCLDAIPIPAETNEMGHFGHAFESVLSQYGDLFQLLTYDAGANSERNAAQVVAAGKDYLFHLKDERWFLLQVAQMLLGPKSAEQAMAQTETVLSNRKSVIRRVWLSHRLEGCGDYQHARTFVRVQSQTLEDGQVVDGEDRYFVSSMEPGRMTPEEWLRVVRRHWRVENDLHKTLFEEDAHPWIKTDPRGSVVVMILRRVAYNLLALFRGVTQRSPSKRATPWRRIQQRLYQMLVALTEEGTRGLRLRALEPQSAGP